MKIKDLPPKLKELALQEQERQGNVRDEELDLFDDKDDGNFMWDEAKQPMEFWPIVERGGYEEARKIYDWDAEESNSVAETEPDEKPTAQLDEAVELRRFKSGAVRSSDRGRIRPDYISPYALEEIAEHFTKAEKDFGSESDSTNYFLGIEPKDVKGSIARHYLDLMKGFAENDEEKIREELRALASNCIMALHQIRIQELGLYKEVYDKTEYIKSDER